jgi:galactokinase/mevalonate kinase-like predicted kinase
VKAAGHHGPITVFAPGRVDLSPGFTDVEPLCAELPGQVVNVALDLGVEVTVGDDLIAPSAHAFIDRLSQSLARRLAIPRPVVLSASGLPAGSGLGSSGALSVALAYAFSLRAGTSVAPADLVGLACAAERDSGLTGGTQDQLASLHGGAGVVHRYRDLGRRIAIDADLRALGERLVLVHGAGSRNSGSIIDRVLHERPRAETMRTVSAMNTVSRQIAGSLRAGDYLRLADLLDASTALLRRLHPDIVGDGVAEWLRALGASGAKPCGAGGTGAVWAALVDPASQPTFAAGIAVAGWSVLPASPSAVGVVCRQPHGLQSTTSTG